MGKERRIGGRFHRIDLLMRYHLRLQEKGLIPPSQMRIIEFIEKNDGCTQAEVAEEMEVSPASVAQSLKRMEASNYVSRDVCKGNLRANSLHITEEGLLAAKNCRRVFDELESEMFSGFSEEEQELTASLLARIITNLESADTDSMNNMELSKLLCSENGGKE